MGIDPALLANEKNKEGSGHTNAWVVNGFGGTRGTLRGGAHHVLRIREMCEF